MHQLLFSDINDEMDGISEGDWSMNLAVSGIRSFGPRANGRPSSETALELHSVLV